MMDEWIQTLDISITSAMPIDVKHKLNAALDHLKGVDSWFWEDERLEVFFNPYEIPEGTIKTELLHNELDHWINEEPRTKGWKGFLKRMAKSNKKKYGDIRLDCSNLND